MSSGEYRAQDKRNGGSVSSLKTALPRHLKSLESESMEIMREVVAEFKCR
jgi:hypothetical protein